MSDINHLPQRLSRDDIEAIRDRCTQFSELAERNQLEGLPYQLSELRLLATIDAYEAEITEAVVLLSHALAGFNRSVYIHQYEDTEAFIARNSLTGEKP